MQIARPETTAEALDALDGLPDADLLAGGTDFMVEVNYGRRRPRSIVALRRISELRGWRIDQDRVILGANLTHRESEFELRAELPALAAASRTVGSPQIRNAATLGGNLCTASPAGDTLPLLMALDAEVQVMGADGARSVPIHEFILGPKRTGLRQGEIVQHVAVPRVRGPQHFMKIGTRNAMVIAVASLALVLDLDGRSVRCGLGSVAPRPLRPRDAEAFIAERIDWGTMRADQGDVQRFAEMTASAASPITDQRSTSEYRRHAVRILAQRALTRGLGQ